jgi:hypothetical protein
VRGRIARARGLVGIGGWWHSLVRVALVADCEADGLTRGLPTLPCKPAFLDDSVLRSQRDEAVRAEPDSSGKLRTIQYAVEQVTASGVSSFVSTAVGVARTAASCRVSVLVGTQPFEPLRNSVNSRSSQPFVRLLHGGTA